MEGIRQYIFSLIAVSVICSVVKRIVGNGSPFGPIIRIICGLFIAVTVLSPWIRIDFSDFDLLNRDVYAQAQAISDSGKTAAAESVASIIMDQTETYILDKAITLDTDISVEVELDDTGKIPYSAVISGDVSPYAKTVLSQYMAKTLAIPEERQQWM